jgi:membrane-associated phospholipid phosphatase
MKGGSGLLAIDRVAIGYLALSGSLALTGGLPGLALASLHGAAILLILRLARRPLPSGRVATFVRLLYPVIATTLLYHEIFILNRFIFPDYFDPIVPGWELALFGSQLSQELAGRLPALWLSEFMTLGYLTYYFLIPLLGIAAWRAGGRAGFHRFAVSVALAFVVCYVWFILFPVMGPRYWYGALEGALSEGTFNRFARDLLESGSSKGTAFPSSHVAATCAAWVAAAREDLRPFFLASVPVATLAIGTVWGGYHYAVDASAGILVAAAVVSVAPRVAASAPVPPDL